jgi:acetyl esterase/lipase
MAAQCTCKHNSVYFQSDAYSLKFDYFFQDSEVPRPLIVFVHGGGWIGGDKSMYHEEAQWLSEQGYHCSCIEYRFAPQYKFPAQLDDIQQFIRFAKSNAVELGIDPGQIILLGNSAGGHLALLAGLTDQEELKPKAVVSICGITDLTLAVKHNFVEAWPFLNFFMPCSYQQNAEIWEKASPSYQVANCTVPVLLMHGTHDSIVPVSQSIELDQILQNNNCKSELHLIHGADHSFSYPQWDEIREHYMNFLKRTLN